jgi:hypothetical protein
MTRACIFLDLSAVFASVQPETFPKSYDGPPTSHLRLTGAAARMLRGEIPVTNSIPIEARSSD